MKTFGKSFIKMTCSPPLDINIALEVIRWDVPDGLTGKRLSGLEELVRLFPSDNTFGGVFLRSTSRGEFGAGLDRYSRIEKALVQSTERSDHPYGTIDVAYGCHSCNGIFIGPPNFKKEGYGGSRMEYSCVGCNNFLHGEIFPLICNG